MPVPMLVHPLVRVNRPPVDCDHGGVRDLSDRQEMGGKTKVQKEANYLDRVSITYDRVHAYARDDPVEKMPHEI